MTGIHSSFSADAGEKVQGKFEESQSMRLQGTTAHRIVFMSYHKPPGRTLLCATPFCAMAIILLLDGEFDREESDVDWVSKGLQNDEA
jgi:hypothetical protein